MKASLKDLAGGVAAPVVLPAAMEPKPERTASAHQPPRTRIDTRQISGHFTADVSQTLKLIAVEQDKDIQEILAQALNMVFERYGKVTRAVVESGRRKRGGS